jgi:hypothetical protein
MLLPIISIYIKIKNMKKDSKTRLFEVMGRLDKTFKPKLNEGFEAEEEISVEPQEHGNEGASYKAKLEEIVELSKKAYSGLPEEELPSWVQDKIVIAKEHLNDICSWMHGEEEEKEGEEEGADREMDAEEEVSTEEAPVEDSEEEVPADEPEELEDLEEKKAKIPVADIAKVGK